MTGNLIIITNIFEIVISIVGAVISFILCRFFYLYRSKEYLNAFFLFFIALGCAWFWIFLVSIAEIYLNEYFINLTNLIFRSIVLLSMIYLAWTIRLRNGKFKKND